MRAYLAVIKDSFREAFSSKILWVLIVMIALFLALLAGLSVAPAERTGLDFPDVFDWPELATRLRDAEADSPAGQLRGRFPADLQSDLRGFQHDGENRRVFRDLRRQLNEQLTTDDFATAIVVPEEKLSEEARELSGRGEGVDEKTRQRLNRLILEAALPNDIRPSPGEVMTPTYIGFEIFDDLTLDQDQLRQVINTALQVFIFFFVSVMGTLIAIVVTAPIVPRMFEPGAIDLLLSKPVSRSLLFLSKFFGGCAFTIVNAAFLIGGMWLIIGIQFGVWSNGLLLSLPVYLFLFVLYYSVSAATGVVFRGPIISVVMVGLFWFACFVVGTAKETAEQFEINGSRIHTIVPVDDALLASNSAGDLQIWSTESKTWERVFDPGPNQLGGVAAMAIRAQQGFPFLGPIYDKQKQRIIAITKPTPIFMPGGGPSRMYIGRPDDNWSRRGGAILRMAPRSIFLSPEGEILVAGPTGLQRFTGDAETPQRPFRVFGLDLGSRSDAGRFVEATPDEMPRWKSPFAATIDPDRGHVVIYSDGTLSLLSPEKNDEQVIYTPGANRDLDTDEAALLAVAGNTLLVALADGNYRLLDATTLEPKTTIEGPEKPRWAAGSPDGRFLAVLSHTSSAWLFDVANGKPVTNGAISADIHAMAFTDSSSLLVGDLFMRATEYKLPDFSVEASYDPPLSTLQNVYRYALLPIYTVFPKPGELNAVITRLFQEDSTVAMSGNNDDLQADQVEIDIQTPLVSNAIFLIIVLALTCLYVSRKDF